MGKLTISMAIFNSYVSHYQRVANKRIHMGEFNQPHWQLQGLLKPNEHS